MIGQYVTVHGDVISHVNISAVRVEDGGEYRCSAVNRVAKAHHAARLNIYGLPHVRTMGNYAAVAGETTVIKCPVAGFPIASITWEKGSPLRQSRFPVWPISTSRNPTLCFIFLKNIASSINQNIVRIEVSMVQCSCKLYGFTYRDYTRTQIQHLTFLFDEKFLWEIWKTIVKLFSFPRK